MAQDGREVVYTFQAASAILPLRAKAGDLIVVRPGDPDPISVVHFAGANYGAVAGYVADGALIPATHPADVALAALVRLAAAPRAAAVEPHAPPRQLAAQP